MRGREFLARLLGRVRAGSTGMMRAGDGALDDGRSTRAPGHEPAEHERTESPSMRDRFMRALALLSAVVAAFVCAALLFNYVIMPILVRQGDTVIVPDVVGLSSVAAERAARQAGLGSRVDTERPDPEAPGGTVVAQTPQAGTEVKRGRTIALAISSGIDMRRLPRLTGLNARQAQLDAEQAGFAIREAIEVHSDHVERGRVIGTCPSDGAALPAGSGITMMVSLGPEPTELVMPSLVGRTPEEARLIAEGLGLVMRSVKYERGSGRTSREIVVVQDPVAGSHVVEGDAVTLRIGD